MTPPRANGKKWIWAIAIVLFVLAAAAAALLIVGGGGLSARYDEAAALLTGYDSTQTPAAIPAGDGTTEIRMTRDDLYFYARRYGLLTEIREDLAAAGITAAGFRLSDGQLTVYARYRTWGFLPLSYRAVMDLRWENGLVLQTQKLSFGNHMTIPASRWPAVFTRPYTIPAEKISPLIHGARLDGDALVLSHMGLGRVLTRSLPADTDALTAMALFDVSFSAEDDAEAFVRTRSGGLISPGDIRSLMAGGAQEQTLIRILALAEPSALRELAGNADRLTADLLVAPLMRTVEAERGALDNALAAEQAKYEKLLSSVRESYKSGGLAIAESGFVSAATGEIFDPAALTPLSATATDCRIVFLFSSLGGGEICSRDMPVVSDVARAGKEVMEGLLDETLSYDLGVTLTSEGGTPLLLCRRADDAFVLREIGEALYVSLLVERSNPVLDMSLLPAPDGSVERAAGEGWSGAVILLAPQTDTTA